MGRFETVPTSQIMPSQDYLKEETLRFILSCLEKGETDMLPPTPYVRRDPQSEEYIAIDGHNLIAVCDHTLGEVEVYIAESEADGLEPTTTAIALRNQGLAAKYESSVTQAHKLQERGLTSFKQLRANYTVVADQN